MVFISVISLSFSCIKLDSLVFNGEKIDAYLLDAYPETTDISDLPSSYNIASQYIKLFTLNSQLPNETEEIGRASCRERV